MACALALGTIAAGARAAPLELFGVWYETPVAIDASNVRGLAAGRSKPVPHPARTGGNYVYISDLQIARPGTYVLDFKNSSTLGIFRHFLFDARDDLIWTSEGGIQSSRENPFSLRHGREVSLSAGHFRLVTSLSAPFFLAQPTPFVDSREHYSQAIKPGNLLVPVCLGIFLGLGLYYAALALMRRRLADGMYAVFLLGNALYNGTALLVYPDVFGVHWFYLVSVPILFSNMAYVVFVISLLDIRRSNHPWLFAVGAALLGVMACFVLAALVRPNWSLELDRYGVAMFVSYGVVAGMVRAREGDPIAPAYLVAVAVLFVLATVAISVSGLQTYTICVEHLGLMAVSAEGVLLAVVLARQFCLESARAGPDDRAAPTRAAV